MQKQIVGKIVGKSANKTVKVAISRRVKHALYHKQFTKTKKFLVHDEIGNHEIGQEVKIIETKPISKLKHYKIVQ